MTTHGASEQGRYLQVIRRRAGLMAAVFLFVMIGAVVLAFQLPAVYRATTTVLIEQQDVPSDWVETTVTGYVVERVEAIAQRVMTQENLAFLARKAGLYKEEMALGDAAAVVAAMKLNIHREMVTAEVSDPRATRGSVANVAFSLSFDGPTSESAQTVANDLAAMFIRESYKASAAQAQEVVGFFTRESERLKSEVDGLERQLADFKTRHGSVLPELSETNVQLRGETLARLDAAEERAQALAARKAQLEALLRSISRNAPQPVARGEIARSPSERLSMLETEYLGAVARYSPDHPDVRKMQRELDLLRQGAGSAPGGASVEFELETAQAELSVAREAYSDEHPDVVALKRKVETLEAERKRASSAVSPSVAAGVIDNPQYIETRAQLEAIITDLEAERRKVTQLRGRMSEYDQRITATPSVERDYRTLLRDYENAVKKYGEVKDKERQATLSRELEHSQQGARFSIADPAAIPSEPISPNRMGIVLLGTVLALGSGLGAGAAAEATDRTVRGAYDIAAIMGAAPLCAIPRIVTASERTHSLRRRWATAGLFVLVLGAAGGTMVAVKVLPERVIATLGSWIHVAWVR